MRGNDIISFAARWLDLPQDAFPPALQREAKTKRPVSFCSGALAHLLMICGGARRVVDYFFLKVSIVWLPALSCDIL